MTCQSAASATTARAYHKYHQLHSPKGSRPKKRTLIDNNDQRDVVDYNNIFNFVEKSTFLCFSGFVVVLSVDPTCKFKMKMCCDVCCEEKKTSKGRMSESINPKTN